MKYLQQKNCQLSIICLTYTLLFIIKIWTMKRYSIPFLFHRYQNWKKILFLIFILRFYSYSCVAIFYETFSVIEWPEQVKQNNKITRRYKNKKEKRNENEIEYRVRRGIVYNGQMKSLKNEIYIIHVEEFCNYVETRKWDTK